MARNAAAVPSRRAAPGGRRPSPTRPRHADHLERAPAAVGSAAALRRSTKPLLVPAIRRRTPTVPPAITPLATAYSVEAVAAVEGGDALARCRRWRWAPAALVSMVASCIWTISSRSPTAMAAPDPPARLVPTEMERGHLGGGRRRLLVGARSRRWSRLRLQ